MEEGLLRGRGALVTGSSGGIGRRIALALAGAGADVAINYNTSRGAGQEVAEAVRALGVRSELIQADCTRPAEVRRLVAEVERGLGRLDILVNNVGVFAEKPLAEHDDDEFAGIMDGTAGTTFWASTAALPGMRQRGWGRIVNLGAAGAEHALGRRGIGPHIAGKAAVVSLTRTMALEWGRYGITVNVVNPGVIMDRDLTRAEAERMQDRQAPVGRPGTSDDVADAVLFLASPQSGFVNGAVLAVAGGWQG